MRDYANKCIENLLGDLKIIEKENISKEDYKTAAKCQGAALLRRQYYPLKEQIKQLHSGTLFAVSVEGLRDNLEQGDVKIAMGYMQMVRACGAQNKLPGGD